MTALQNPTQSNMKLHRNRKIRITALLALLGTSAFFASCERHSASGTQSLDELAEEVAAKVAKLQSHQPPGVPFRSDAAVEEDEPLQGEEIAVLTDPPHVPPAITRKHPSRVKVRLEVIEVEKPMVNGTTYTYWTFGGHVPGKFIRVRQNDEVEFTLANHPTSKMPHNIDLHAVTGPGGGAASSMTAPGHESVFSFKALNPGLFIYHCATAPVGMHVANGMYGLIYVEPKAGLPPVDREYYICQGDFYTKGKYGMPGLQPFDMEKALHEHPDYVVFNGSVGAIAGDNALTAKVGERVRLFVGNGGPNLSSAFHVIGEIFDNLHAEGGSAVTHNVQTTMIPPGAAAIAEFRLDVPGTYILVDHALLRAFNKGALGMLKVSGEEDKVIYSGKLSDLVYQPEGSDIQKMPQETAPAAPVAKNKDERIAFGKSIYARVCLACHQAEGQGVPMAFPPLAKSDYLNADVDRAIRVVAFGMTGEITVNGAQFNSVMPQLDFTDEEIANVLTYVYNSFENNGTEVTPEQVQKARELGPLPTTGAH